MKRERYYIVGPCAAESREQVLECAREIVACVGPVLADGSQAEACAERLIYRAGVWKPRTSPDTFQGAGEEALEWLRAVKEQYHLPVATEVATPEHVKAALEAGIDYLWIGARTSANPMAVQEIADQIKKEELKIKGILIKNPVNNDAGLWLGNIARLERTGLPVMAIHRGCGHAPCWSMAHMVRLARPDIPMLLDPSHMSGDAQLVPELAKKIDTLGLDGAMIEVHPHPESALSDADQQITPMSFRSVVVSLSCRCRVDVVSLSCLDREEEVELQWLRAEIDELDAQLWKTIADRMEVSKRIGEWKKARGIAPLQPQRYQEIVEKIKESGLRSEFALALWELIHNESLRQQS